MSHAAPTGDGQISRGHNLAIREEIGERLRFNFDSDRTEMPLYLDS
jgi:hypothetical protein